MQGQLPRRLLAVALVFAVTLAAAAGEILSTMRNVNAVVEAYGYRLNIIHDVDIPPMATDLSPAQAFEVLKPAGKPVTIGRLFTSCSCIQLESPKRTFSADERAILTLRNVKPTPAPGQVYAVFVQITSPVRTTLRFDTFVQSGMAGGMPYENPVGGTDDLAARQRRHAAHLAGEEGRQEQQPDQPNQPEQPEQTAQAMQPPQQPQAAAGYVGTSHADAVAALTRQIDQGFTQAASRSGETQVPVGVLAPVPVIPPAAPGNAAVAAAVISAIETDAPARQTAASGEDPDIPGTGAAVEARETALPALVPAAPPETPALRPMRDADAADAEARELPALPQLPPLAAPIGQMPPPPAAPALAVADEEFDSLDAVAPLANPVLQPPAGIAFVPEVVPTAAAAPERVDEPLPALPPVTVQAVLPVQRAAAPESALPPVTAIAPAAASAMIAPGIGMADATEADEMDFDDLGDFEDEDPGLNPLLAPLPGQQIPAGQLPPLVPAQQLPVLTPMPAAALQPGLIAGQQAEEVRTATQVQATPMRPPAGAQMAAAPVQPQQPLSTTLSMEELDRELKNDIDELYARETRGAVTDEELLKQVPRDDDLGTADLISDFRDYSSYTQPASGAAAATVSVDAVAPLQVETRAAVPTAPVVPAVPAVPETTAYVAGGQAPDVTGGAFIVEEIYPAGAGAAEVPVPTPASYDSGIDPDYDVEQLRAAGDNLPPPPGLSAPAGGVGYDIPVQPAVAVAAPDFGDGVPEPRPSAIPESRRPVQAVSLITVGVRDMPSSIRFYEALGWRRAARGKYDQTAFFQLQGQILALYPMNDLLVEQNMPSAAPAPGGITLALHVQDRSDVWAVYQRFIDAGGASLRQPAEMASGAVTSYVADPDGNAWEISWVPQFRIDEEGGLWLP